MLNTLYNMQWKRVSLCWKARANLPARLSKS